MTTRSLMLLALLAFAGCAAAPEPAATVARAAPSFCDTADEAGPSYSQADLSARIAESKAALPEGATIATLTAIARPAPQFPRCAISNGIEGQCDMVFDVLPDGTTANILPVCSNRIFERDAVAAVRRWTFAPPGDGPRPAVVNRLTFKLGDLGDAPVPTQPGLAAE